MTERETWEEYAGTGPVSFPPPTEPVEVISVTVNSNTVNDLGDAFDTLTELSEVVSYEAARRGCGVAELRIVFEEGRARVTRG